jgi:tRNA threonylcarbamoyladenosine biosynthesis protein TsaB
MILAADTSSFPSTVAIVGKDYCHVTTRSGGAARSAQLFYQMHEVMARAGLMGYRELDALALGSGPGSFVGLRVSFSAFRSLAWSLDVPLILVNSLDAMAEPFRELAANIVVLQRARNGFAFGAVYRNGVRQGTCRYLSLDETVRLVEGLPGSVLLLGSFCDEPDLSARFRGSLLADRIAPDAGVVGRMALAKLARGETTPFAVALPEYLRLSDAEHAHAARHDTAASQILDGQS